MYQTIINPKTNRPVSIFGKIGQKVLSKYINNLYGGEDELLVARYQAEQKAMEIAEGLERAAETGATIGTEIVQRMRNVPNEMKELRKMETGLGKIITTLDPVKLTPVKFEIDQKVNAIWDPSKEGNDVYWPGTIVKAYDDHTYKIAWDDGDETGTIVPAAKIHRTRISGPPLQGNDWNNT